MTSVIPRIAIVPGEPAGIGPDIVLALANHPFAAELVVFAHPDLLAQRAAQLGMAQPFLPWTAGYPATAGTAYYYPVPLQYTHHTSKCDGVSRGERASRPSGINRGRALPGLTMISQ